MAEETQEVETTRQSAGSLVLSFKHPTPMWMILVFRVEFFLNKAFMMWVSSSDIIPSTKLKMFLATMTAIDFFVWGIGRSLGIKPPDDGTTKS